MNANTIEKMRSICDQFVAWQREDGGIETERCPFFAPEYHPFLRYMEIPFMARALYAMHERTGEEKYRSSAGKYMFFYVDLICNLIPKERIAYKFGMAMEAAALLAKNDPLRAGEMAVYIRLFAKWLRQLKDQTLGSYFRCGYLPGTKGIANATDVGFSDDLCHVGRGLTRAYELTRDRELLQDMQMLSRYFTTDQKDGTMEGIWNPALGTWSIGPWPDVNFEHMADTPANRAGWVFSAYGDAEFLMDAQAYYDDAGMRRKIREKSTSSVAWIFRACAFEDGAVGMTGLDDKWLGLTAAGVLGALKLYRHGALDSQQLAALRLYVQRAWSFLLANTGENLPEAGYIKVTGHTRPVPGDNVAWLYAWIVECLAKEDEMTAFLHA